MTIPKPPQDGKSPEQTLADWDNSVITECEWTLAEALRAAIKERDEALAGHDLHMQRKCDALRAKLAIAVEALKQCYATSSEYPGCFEEVVTSEALKKIEELK